VISVAFAPSYGEHVHAVRAINRALPLTRLIRRLTLLLLVGSVV